MSAEFQAAIGGVIWGICAAVFGGLALYGFKNKRFPLRGWGYLKQADQPVRFRRWLIIFCGGSIFAGFIGAVWIVQAFVD